MLIEIMWFHMLGAALASRERSHLSADFVKVLSKNPKVWRAAALISTAISLFIAIMFVTWAWDLFSWAFKKNSPLQSLVFHGGFPNRACLSRLSSLFSIFPEI